MTDTDRMVVWLRETMNAALRDAEAAHAVDPAPWTADISNTGSPERFRSGALGTGAGMIRDAHGEDLWECEGTETLCMTSASAKHAARHDPEAVLRRIGAERKMLALHQNIAGKCDECGRGYELSDWGPDFPCTTVRLLAEGWGWTEETTKSDWPECMCTPSGECGNCWEKRQGTPNAQPTPQEAT